MTLGAFITSVFVGPIASFMGRRMAIWCSCLLCCVANIIMMSTTSIGWLYVGRLLIGLANGGLMTFSQLYIQECSPARYRGLMISSFQFFTSFGTLVGTIVDNFTAKINGRDSYLIPLGLIYIVPVILSIALLFIPESPRWLVQYRTTERAKKSLKWLRPSEDMVAPELEDIIISIEKEKDIASKVSIWDMFRNPIDRRRTVIAVAGVSLQGASGAMFMIGEFALKCSIQLH
jgi:MFS transporter, SP family, sugar:H+ symporter